MFEGVGRWSLVTCSGGRMRCCPAGWVLSFVGCSSGWLRLEMSRRSWMNLAPGFLSEGSGCDSPDSAAVYPLPRRSRDLFRRQTLPSPGSCTENAILALPAFPKSSPFPAVPSWLSARMNRRDFMGRVWWENGVLGWQKGLIPDVVLAKLLKQGAHLLIHQQGYF